MTSNKKQEQQHDWKGFLKHKPCSTLCFFLQPCRFIDATSFPRHLPCRKARLLTDLFLLVDSKRWLQLTLHQGHGGSHQLSDFQYVLRKSRGSQYRRWGYPLNWSQHHQRSHKKCYLQFPSSEMWQALQETAGFAQVTPLRSHISEKNAMGCSGRIALGICRSVGKKRKEEEEEKKKK